MSEGTSSTVWQPSRQCLNPEPHHHIAPNGEFFRCISLTKGDGLCPQCNQGRQRFGVGY